MNLLTCSLSCGWLPGYFALSMQWNWTPSQFVQEYQFSSSKLTLPKFNQVLSAIWVWEPFHSLQVCHITRQTTPSEAEYHTICRGGPQSENQPNVQRPSNTGSIVSSRVPFISPTMINSSETLQQDSIFILLNFDPQGFRTHIHSIYE
ncbi:hypothetical protein ABPG72_016542 [Tetrahymena utriculariae]